MVTAGTISSLVAAQRTASEQIASTIEQKTCAIARTASFCASQSVTGQVVSKGAEIVNSVIEGNTSQNRPEIHVKGGFLPGATTVASPHAKLPRAPRRRVKVMIPAPEGVKLRDGQAVPTFIVQLKDGPRVAVKVPLGLKPGNKVSIMVRDYSKMITSTLQMPPLGYKVLLQKPILFATARQSQEHKPDIGAMFAIAQHRLVRQAHTAGCNAVLGISFNVMNNVNAQSEGEVVVSAFGTPCITVLEAEENTPLETSDGSAAKDDDTESCASYADTAAESDVEVLEDAKQW